MKSKAAIQDHPIHPMLVSIPIGLFVGSLACDVIGAASGNRKLNNTGYQMMIGGLVGGLAAAVPGLIDYLTVVPPDSEAEDTARVHALCNVGLLGLFGANAILRSRGGSLPFSLVLSGMGMAVMGYAGWLGGNLVYRDQIGIDHLAAEGHEHLTLPTCEALVGDFVSVCSKNDLKKGQMALLTINGTRMVLARLDEDRFVAAADACTHVGGPLSDGTLMGESVLCPWHGSQFNLTSGKVESGPACDAIATYEVQIEGDRVQVRAPTLVRHSLIEAGSLG